MLQTNPEAFSIYKGLSVHTVGANHPTAGYRQKFLNPTNVHNISLKTDILAICTATTQFLPHPNLTYVCSSPLSGSGVAETVDRNCTLNMADHILTKCGPVLLTVGPNDAGVKENNAWVIATNPTIG